MGKTKSAKCIINPYDTGTLNLKQWETAKDKVIGIDRQRFQIGTLSEKTVHAVVKNYYEPDEDHQEIPIEGKCADIYSADEKIIEIQTRSFSRLKEKLNVFLPLYDVTVILPLPDRKRIIWIDPETGEESECGTYRSALAPWPAFKEIYSIRNYLTDPNLHIRILLMNMTEYRLLSGRSKDRKRFGAERYDRIPEGLTGEIILNEPKDYMLFLPELPDTFTSAELAEEARIPKQYLSYVTGLLRLLGIIKRLSDKQGRAWLYKTVE